METPGGQKRARTEVKPSSYEEDGRGRATGGEILEEQFLNQTASRGADSIR